MASVMARSRAKAKARVAKKEKDALALAKKKRRNLHQRLAGGWKSKTPAGTPTKALGTYQEKPGGPIKRTKRPPRVKGMMIPP